MIRRLRANLLDELQKQYVVTGRAKGLSPLKLLVKYPLRHAINPFVADIGGLLPEVLSGSVIVSVRPEDVELSEGPPTAAAGDNVCRGTVNAKDFLGDYLDFHVKVGDLVLLAKAHPSLRTPTGDAIYLHMKAEKCVAIPELRNL